MSVVKRSLYDVLQVSNKADPEVIEAAYTRLTEKLRADPSENAQSDLKLVREAFAVLSVPEKRAAYDLQLAERPATTTAVAPVIPTVLEPANYKGETASIFIEWWYSPKVTALVILLAIFTGLGLLLNYTKEDKKTAVAKEQVKNEAAKIEKAAVIEYGKVENERVLIDRTLDSQEKFLEVQRDLAAKRLDLQQQAQERARRESEARLEANLREEEFRRKQLEYQRQEQARAHRMYEEARATAAARAQADRDRAELCRMERARYGRSLSC